eukprot:6009867-Prorocentrum_lima.AAC.1
MPPASASSWCGFSSMRLTAAGPALRQAQRACLCRCPCCLHLLVRDDLHHDLPGAACKLELRLLA